MWKSCPNNTQPDSYLNRIAHPRRACYDLPTSAVYLYEIKYEACSVEIDCGAS